MYTLFIQGHNDHYLFLLFCSTIVFIFVCLQAGSTVLAVMRYRTGITEEFAQPGQQPGAFPGADPSGQQQSAYPSYPSATDTAAAADPYQQQHGGFNQGQFQGQQQPGGFQPQQGGFQSEQKMPPGDFQPPTY